MANSIITALGDGVTTQYALNFTLGILSRDYVTCRVGSEVDGLGAPVYRTLEWVTDGLVNIQGAVPGNNVPIVFKRTVPKNELVHDYSDGVPITEENLDESNLQTMMAIHEFLDGRLEGGFVQDLNMNSFKIINLADGTDPADAVNFSQLTDMTGNAPLYAAQAAASASQAQSDRIQTGLDRIDVANNTAIVQAAAQGLAWKAPVRAATTANITLSAPQTIDGISVIAGDRVLVKNQSTASQNGIYVVAAGAWTRATDMDTWAEFVSAAVIVQEGSTQADLEFRCTVNAGGTVGSTAVVFASPTAAPGTGSILVAMFNSAAYASQAEAEGGTENTKIMTALRTKQAIDINTPTIRQIPQNSKSAAYTTVSADQGYHIYHPSADTTARVWTIDSNANVPYPIGTAITFVNDTSGGVITIAITSDTLVMAGSGATGSRTLAANGIATAIKMTSTRWMISGVNLT